MATATKRKPEKIFTKAEVADRQKDLIQQRLGILPIEVTAHGYYYDGKEMMGKLKELKAKGWKP
ncbi:MAG: hypothetical protein SH817_08375 [Leptospira sp.]|nr:hypothetical protein [Leptospira sp.]